MKALLTLLAALLTVGMTGCDSHDPAKWYFTRYENNRFIFQHDHKVYTAECFQSFGASSKEPDATDDCTAIIDAVGIGHEVPEKNGQDAAWTSMGTWAVYTPIGDAGPQYQFKFVSIKEGK